MGKIEVIGLGAGDIGQLPLKVYRTLTDHKKTIFVRTMGHPVVSKLQEEGVSFRGFDDYYEAYDDFPTVYEQIVATLLKEAQDETITYAVPGHPMVAEKTVDLLLQQDNIKIDIIGGQSFLDDLFTALQIDPVDGFQFVDATLFTREELNYKNHLLFSQVYDAFIASDVKLTLLEDVPPTFEVTVVEAAGTSEEKITKVPLVELDRAVQLSNLTSIYVPPVPQEILTHQFTTLRSVIALLRSPNGCPWDRKQTHESLRKYMIEEAYELIEAINNEDDDGIIEELGDVLLQVMLHSQIGEDNGYFTIDDVILGITEKMIHRHPHVFGKSDPTKSWDELKQEENGGAQKEDSIMSKVNPYGPALQIANNVQKEAAKVGFDWDNSEAVWEKWREEKEEFSEALQQENQVEMENEFGDMLFVLVNIARFHQIDAELALVKTNNKFMRRFTAVEKQVLQTGKKFTDMTLAELDVFWDNAKREE